MLYLNKEKLKALAAGQGRSLADIARVAGVSRQSLYNMFHGQTIFNRSFEKLIVTLEVSYRDIAEEFSDGDRLLADAPKPIQHIAMRLIEYCRQSHASLLLFGSRARGKRGPHADWDFAVHFQTHYDRKRFHVIKTDLQDAAFPYRIDIVNLNDAPSWFRKGVDKSRVVLYGAYR